MFNILSNKLSITFDKVSYYSLLFFAFSFPLSRAAISFFIFWFLLLVLFKRDYRNSFSLLKENSIFLFIALFLGYLYFTLFWTEDFSIALRQVRMYSYWILIPCFVILAKKQWLYSILNAFLLGMFVSEILAYGMFFDLWTINGKSSNYPTPFMTHIHYSVFLAFTSLVLFYRFLFENSSIVLRLSMFLFFLITSANLMFSTGRTGQLAFFVTLFIVFFIRYRINIRSLILSTLVLVFITFVSYNTFSLFNQRVNFAINDIQKISNQNYNTSFGIRAVYWMISFDSFKEKPLLGSGLGDYHIVAKEMIAEHKYKGINEQTKAFIEDSHFHNQYLMILVQGGLLGLIFMIVLFYKLFCLKIDDIELKHISIIGFCVVLISFIAEPLFLLQFPLVLFLFITALAIVASKNEQHIT